MENKSFLQKLPAILPGMAVMVLTLYALRTWVEPWMGATTLFGMKGILVKVVHLNYILLAIIVGMLYRNVLFGGKIPGWAEEGFRTTRLFIKTGVIMLGSLYTIQSLAKVGGDVWQASAPGRRRGMRVWDQCRGRRRATAT